MTEDEDLSELERRMRAKFDAMTAKPTAEDAAEQAMIAKLFGSPHPLTMSTKGTRAQPDVTEKRMIEKLFGAKTTAQEFLRHEGRNRFRTSSEPVRNSRIDIRQRPKTFRATKPRLHFEYYDLPETDPYLPPRWRLQRFENGRRVSEIEDTNLRYRDDLIIRLQAAGITCTPVAVGGKSPRIVQGRMRDQRKAPSGRFLIIGKLAAITSRDVADFDPRDIDPEDYRA